MEHLIAGLEKRYTLNCLESEIMQASVDKESLPTYLLAEASELSRWLKPLINAKILACTLCVHLQPS